MAPPSSIINTTVTSADPSSGLLNTPLSHGVVGHKETAKVVDTYADSWTDDGKDDEQKRASRMSRYEEITNSYYNLATDFYEFGW